MNQYGLDENELARIRERDILCVYCGKEMTRNGAGESRMDWPTIEHLHHLPPWDHHPRVAICCWSCNGSRRDLLHEEWFASEYCREREISIDTVAQPVRDYLARRASLLNPDVST